MRFILGLFTGFYLIVQIISPHETESAVYETLWTDMPDGVRLKVHFQKKFNEEKNADDLDPAEVLAVMEDAYALLTGELGYGDWSRGYVDQVELYLTDPDNEEELAGNAFQSSALGLSPRFMMLEYQNRPERSPVIFLPKDYKAFLRRWRRVNGHGDAMTLDDKRALAGSIMHEMTHAVLFGYHENLGSTVGGHAHGDWYTEGLARYYETKVGSLLGFTDEGFRRVLGDRMQFSRGGANYYLRYHDEAMFSLRYENALFWLYFEKSFGHEKIVDLTRALGHVTYEGDPRQYVQVLQSVTGYPFYRILVDYHNWIYREAYRSYTEGEALISPTTIVSVWDAEESKPWREESLDDVQPHSFQIHEILLESGKAPELIRLRSVGFSQHVCAYVYLISNDKTTVREYHATVDEEIEIAGLDRGVEAIDIVFSNLDDRHAFRYEIEIPRKPKR